MRKTGRTVATIIFVAIVVGCAFAVLYLGTSTGLTFGGAGSELTQATGSNAVYAQVGWLRNTAPWPVTIESITTNESHSSNSGTVFLERGQVGDHASSGGVPTWVRTASRPPYQLDGGSLRYLGFVVHPDKNAVSYVTSITVSFTGPLGLRFRSTFPGTVVVAASSGLPSGVMAQDPRVDSASLDGYILALRSALLQPSGAAAATVMGSGATAVDGAALLKRESGYVTADGVTVTPDPGNRRRQRVVFYLDDPVKGALPSILVEWSGYRWSVVRT